MSVNDGASSLYGKSIVHFPKCLFKEPLELHVSLATLYVQLNVIKGCDYMIYNFTCKFIIYLNNNIFTTFWANL